MSDEPVAEAATYTTHTTNIHALSGVRIHDPINQTASDVSLRPHGQLDRLLKLLGLLNE
jgi:hypothetical protein